jgi:crotonobetaine/carnitine-CoA ligase
MRIHDIDDLEQRRLDRCLRRQAELIGDDVWLLSGDRQLTYAEADRIVDRYANGLNSLGMTKGDVVTMVMDPSIEVALLGLAAQRLGGIMATLNTDYTGAFLQDSIAASKARIVIADAEFEDALARLERVGRAEHVLLNGSPQGVLQGAEALDSLLESPDTPPPTADLHYSDVAQIWWSSGTTGKSKGVMHTHSGLMQMGSYVEESEHERLREGDRFYSCTPMYLGSPWTGAVWRSLINGLSAAIDRRFSVTQFWDRTRFYNTTHIFTLGAMHMHLLNADPKPDDKDNPVRVALCVPMTHDLIPPFKEKFGIAAMPQAYGQSETFTIFSAPDNGTPWKHRTAGSVTGRYDVKLLDEDDREVPVGNVGEICIRPKHPHMMFAGYLDDPEKTNAMWRNLWHHTGDMAVVDEDGEYYFADRKQDYIRYKGRNVSMYEVESVVIQHPAVKEVAAFGVKSEELESESELMACIVLEEGQNVAVEDLATFINDNAPYYFVPRFLTFAEALPRNDHGRVMKHLIRDEIDPKDAWDRDQSGFEVTRRRSSLS